MVDGVRRNIEPPSTFRIPSVRKRVGRGEDIGC